jgi:hypothetical protein
LQVPQAARVAGKTQLRRVCAAEEIFSVLAQPAEVVVRPVHVLEHERTRDHMVERRRLARELALTSRDVSRILEELAKRLGLERVGRESLEAERPPPLLEVR